MQVQTVTACPDCGGALDVEDDYSICEFALGDFVGVGVGVIGCGFDADLEASGLVGGAECLHGLPSEWCGSCTGAPESWVRSKVTGKVRYSPDLISWFVPSALGHDGSAGRGWANFVGVAQGSGALSDSVGGEVVDHAPEGLGVLDGLRRFDLGEVGAPEWYRGGSAVGEVSVSEACADGGLDWYGMSEAYAADMALSLLPSGTVEPAPVVSGIDSATASTMYGGAALAFIFDKVDGRERLLEWRAATGRANGASAGMGRGWAV